MDNQILGIKMYIFKYHPDNIIYINGQCSHTYEEFIASYPEFPITERQFFEYRDDGFDLINSQGHHFPQDLSLFEDLIKTIGGIYGV